MTVLVTGGAGYIGSIIAEQLLQQRVDVLVLDNLVQGHRRAILDGATFVEGDVGNQTLINGVFTKFDIEAVIHMAAETVIARSMSDPQSFFNENVVKGVALLDAMREHDVNRIIFSSTAAVYGEPQEVPITEGHPVEPINAYGESKLMFERILEWYHRAYGLKSISLRYFNAAGASDQLGEDHDPESHLIPLVLQTALGRRAHVEIYGTDYPTEDGTCVRDFIHVVDLAEAHIRALERIDEIERGTYNLGSGRGNSVREVIETARRVTGREIPIVEGKRRVGDPAVLVASPQRAKQELEWRLEYEDLESIIGSAWAWHREHPEGYGS